MAPIQCLGPRVPQCSLRAGFPDEIDVAAEDYMRRLRMATTCLPWQGNRM
jgi:hypothetical protein